MQLGAFARRGAGAVSARLGQRGSAAPDTVANFDLVAGAELVEVDLPRDPAPTPSSRTVQSELHPMFTRGYSQPAYPLRVATVPGAELITGSGTVLAPDGRLVMETLWDAPHYEREFGRPRPRSVPTRVEGTHASLISLWCNNYFHWMFNALPRIAVLQASGVHYDGLIVPEPLKRFQRESLAVLGVPESKLTPFAGEHLAPERLVWVAPLAPINEPSSFLLEWVRESLGPPPGIEPERRFYLSREGGTRDAANERELLAALQPLGFERLLPESLSFQEQVSTFASGAVFVGPHGSNFVNAIFPRRASILEFVQPAHVNWGLYTVLCAAGQDHWNLMCEPVRRRGPRKFDDMQVPVGEVLESVQRMLDEPAEAVPPAGSPAPDA